MEKALVRFEINRPFASSEFLALVSGCFAEIGFFDVHLRDGDGNDAYIVGRGEVQGRFVRSTDLMKHWEEIEQVHWAYQACFPNDSGVPRSEFVNSPTAQLWEVFVGLSGPGFVESMGVETDVLAPLPRYVGFDRMLVEKLMSLSEALHLRLEALATVSLVWDYEANDDKIWFKMGRDGNVTISQTDPNW